MEMEASCKNLLHMLAKNRTLGELVDACAAALDNPLLLLDSTFDPIAVSATDEISDEIWVDSLSGNARGKSYADERFTISLMREVMSSSKPILTDYNLQRSRRIVSRVASGGRILGYIVCLEVGAPFPDHILFTAEMVCDVLAIELQRMHSLTLSERTPYQDILRDVLLRKREVDTYSNTFWNAVYGDPNTPRCMFCIPWSAETVTREQLAYVQSHMQIIGHHLQIVDLDGELAALAVCLPDSEVAVMERISSLLESYHLRCGVSEPFTDISHIHIHYQQAQHAAEIGAALTKETVCYFTSYMLDDLIRRLSPETDLRQYRPVAILRISKYDTEHGTDYLATLEEYLRQSGNISKVANRLYTHRNTIVHRIKRIQELCGTDLENGEIRAQLTIGLKINRLLGDCHTAYKNI